jgi:predicted RND superfamily exporter protein
VNTLPMVALGAGIGVDYGIYLWSRMQEYLRDGDDVRHAFEKTMRVTGASIIFTGITLAIGVITWVFSPLQFQADIGIMLTFMFFVNMLGAIILLPALAAWLVRPKSAPDRRNENPDRDDHGVPVSRQDSHAPNEASMDAAD